MKITSPDFKNKEKIPIKFTGDGEDINPNLIIGGAPKNTKSLVLIADDPDCPGGWNHWIIWNISPETGKIMENSVPENAVQGRNSWGRSKYGGPKPPSGTHRYFFKIFALDVLLNLEEGNRQELEEAMKGHVIEKAELIGLYR